MCQHCDGDREHHVNCPADPIREDLFAVKVYEDCGATNGWVVKTISGNRHRSNRIKVDIQSDKRRPFPLVDPVVIHPRQSIVNAYVLLGNEIK